MHDITWETDVERGGLDQEHRRASVIPRCFPIPPSSSNIRQGVQLVGSSFTNGKATWSENSGVARSYLRQEVSEATCATYIVEGWEIVAVHERDELVRQQHRQRTINR